ncbi:MAG: AAA family ATPase [Ruminococcus sp.]|nr:AAA family ATPase [Ruminococcus sp.]
MEQFKPIPIGVEDFKRLIDDGYYFVDKTLMIRDIIESKGSVKLFTRPRRFGKTLNMSMIQRYFEKTEEDNSHLFDGLNISKAGEKYKEYQGQYPVITLSLKSMKQPSYEYAFKMFKTFLVREFERHDYILKCDAVPPTLKSGFEQIYYGIAEDSAYVNAIRLLSDCLSIVHQKNVIILIDEYDVPLENAYFRGFYDEMVDLIRSAFESALKTNSSLEFGVLTGCLRISKESIFTGLNNLKVNSITTLDFSEYFGFTRAEVEAFAAAYHIEERLDDIKDWYDGYLFGKTEIYNPWSIINFISDARANRHALIKPYWSNTSSNDIIHQLINEGNEETRRQIEELLGGGFVDKPIYEDITYRNVKINSDYIWSFLLFTGYLKQIESRLEEEIIYSKMVIPNREVKSIYRSTVMQWFEEKRNAVSRDDLFEAVLQGDEEQFEELLGDWLDESISYYDGKELYYHGFLSGLLSGFRGYTVKSNRESGLGRPDLLILERRRHKLAVIIEIKVAERFAEMETKCDEALQQIEDRNYEAELVDDCYQKIIKYGVAFYQKSCRVKMA